MNTLQFAIDLGRLLASTEHDATSDTVRAAAQNVIDTLGIPLKVDEEPALLLGLGYGLGDRHKEPLDEAARGLMGQVDFKD